jgi:hypothetical protein
MRSARWLFTGLLLALVGITAWRVRAQQPAESKVLDRLEQIEKRLSRLEKLPRIQLPMVPTPEQDLTFTQDGKDLVVSMTVEVPDVPHVVWVHSTLQMTGDPGLEGSRYPPKLDWVGLAYKIIQCQDDPVRIHQSYLKKKVEVRWRLADHRRANVRYVVHEEFSPTAAELKDLAPKLAKLAEETERRLRDPKLTQP